MISIFGIGGIGKTALARKLYNSNDVKKRFDYRAWTCVSQEYKTRDLLQSIIKSFGEFSENELERIERMAEEDLEIFLHRFLQGKIYLVVVDDVWEKEAWESLKRAFPRNVNGSRVVMTTRIKAVAESMDERVYAHKLRFLTFGESWKLFHEKAFRDHERVDRDLEELGRDMVRKCGGLPLAIIVLAGILSRKMPNEWHVVRDRLWRRLKDDFIPISNVLALSFNDLHFELKLCFLYLGIFPEDFEINVEKLIRLLVAEGFIEEDEEIMEDVALQYIHELIDKSLVQVERRMREKVKTVRVHDLLRDLAIKKAKELNFMNVFNGLAPSSTCRREVVHRRMKEYFSAVHSLNARMRSLLLFEEHGECDKTYKCAIICGKLKLLRVLDIRDDGFLSDRSLPEAIGELIHLRYLGIGCYNASHLPASISNLRCLQTLDVSSKVFMHSIDLCKLKSLRHIFGRFLGDLLIGDATNLQTLGRITSRSWSKINRERLINLRELDIRDSVNVRNVCLHMGSFAELKNLRVLRVSTFSIEFSSAEQPLNLESLTIVAEKLEEDPMPVLERFPRLEYLHLSCGNYPRKKMICSAKGFARLTTLKLFIVRLEELQIPDDAMPSLIEFQMLLQQTKLMIPERLQSVLGTA